MQQDPLLGVDIGGLLGHVSEGFGATVAGPIWRAARTRGGLRGRSSGRVTRTAVSSGWPIGSVG